MSRKIDFAVLAVLLGVGMIGAAFWAHSAVTSRSEAEKQAEFTERYNALDAKREEDFTKWYNALDTERQAEFTARYNALGPERLEDFTKWYNALDTERQAEFTARYNALGEEREKEFTQWYNALDEERQAEAKKRAEAINRKVLGSARPVVVDFAFMTTLKQMFLDTGVDKRINEKRAEAQLEPLTIDEVYSDFREEGISEIPQAIQDIAEIFADDTVKVTMSSLLQSGTISQGWFLGKNFVGLLPYAYLEMCRSAREDSRDVFTATFTMYADAASEDARNKEVLFDGTVRQLCSNEGSYPKFYKDQGLLLFKRPDMKLLPVPAENSVVVGSVEELKEGSKLYYPRMTQEGMKVETGFFEGARKFSPTGEIIEFRGEINFEVDIGAPVYYAGEDKNAPVRLVGFVIPRENASAVSARFVLTGVDEVELGGAED